MNLEPIQNAQIDFSEMPFEEGLKWAKKMPEHSSASFAGPLTYPGYKDVPVTYILTGKDKVVPRAMQEEQIGYMRDAGAEVNVLEIPTDHFPYVSAVDEVVSAILKAV